MSPTFLIPLVPIMQHWVQIHYRIIQPGAIIQRWDLEHCLRMWPAVMERRLAPIPCSMPIAPVYLLLMITLPLVMNHCAAPLQLLIILVNPIRLQDIRPYGITRRGTIILLQDFQLYSATPPV